MAMRPSGLLSMSELARRLDLPESTLRYYCKHFAAFLPYVGEGRRRRYAPEALSVLEFIVDAMHRNKNATAVELMLKAGYHKGDKFRIAGEDTHTVAALEAAIPAAAQRLPIDNGLSPTGSATGASKGDFGTVGVQSLGTLLEVMQRQAASLESIAAALHSLAKSLGGEIDPAAGTLTPDADVEKLRKEVADLRHNVLTSEELHQKDLEQLRKWLSHLRDSMQKE